MGKHILRLIAVLLLLCAGSWTSQTAEAVSFNGEWRYQEVQEQTGNEGALQMQFAGMAEDSDSWETFSFPGQPPISPGIKCVWLVTEMPQDISWQNPVLMFVTTEQAVRVYLDNELIYADGDFGIEHSSYGVKWHTVTLPMNYGGRKLAFQLYTSHYGRLGLLTDVSIDENSYQQRQVLEHTILPMLMSPLCLLLIIILLVYYQYMRNNQRVFIYFMCYLALNLVWLVWNGILQTGFVEWGGQDLWYLLNACSLYGMPIFEGLIIYEVVTERWRSWAKELVVYFAVIFLAALTGEFLGYNSIDFGLYTIHLWMGIGQLFAVALLRISMREGNPICRSMLFVNLGIIGIEIVDILAHSLQLASANMHFNVLNVIPAAVFVIWMIRNNAEEKEQLTNVAEELQKKIALTKEQAQIDALTKCFNRGKLDPAMEKEIELAEYLGNDFSLMMFDIDHFKSVNDIYGHDAGDRVLVGFAAVIRRNLDARHIFIRYGGEEFMVLCREFDIDKAAELGERIRRDVEGECLLEGRQITCCVGVSTWHGSDKDTAERMQKRADLALYDAKHGGRNQVRKEPTE